MKKILCILVATLVLFSVSCAPGTSVKETSSRPSVADPHHYLFEEYPTVEELYSCERASISTANGILTVEAIDEEELKIEGYHLFEAELWEHIIPEFVPPEEYKYVYTSLRYFCHSEKVCMENGNNCRNYGSDFWIDFTHSQSEEWPLEKIRGIQGGLTGNIEGAVKDENNDKLYKLIGERGCTYMYLINDKTQFTMFIKGSMDAAMQEFLCEKLVGWGEAYGQKISLTQSDTTPLQ